MLTTLKNSIKLRGPLPLATYMQQCLTHPQHGYYVKQDPFGAKGDFTTSPEISQMFGEIVGINILTQWISQNKNKHIRLVELGPGRGTLMDDLLRTAKTFPEFSSAIKEVLLVEASTVLKKKQKEALEKYGIPLVWKSLVNELPKDGVQTFIVAHEFFDALPINSYEKTAMGWQERVVGLNKESNLEFVLNAPNKLNTALISGQKRYAKLPLLSQIEVCPEAWATAKSISQLLQKNTGGALIIDYGPVDTIPMNTFRAFKNHHPVDPLETPGDADLTADVDFQALKDIFSEFNLGVQGPITQRDWLHQMGIGARATVLANNAKDKDGEQRIASAYNRLVDPATMGKTYKVMAVSTSDAPVAGFSS